MNYEFFSITFTRYRSATFNPIDMRSTTTDVYEYNGPRDVMRPNRKEYSVRGVIMCLQEMPSR